MNYDWAHCADYDDETCPRWCWRGELVRNMKAGDIATFTHFKNTADCPFRQSCKTCIHRLSLSKWDYSKKGSNWKTPQEGYVCDLFAGDGKAVWMVGLDDGMCEMWMEK